MKLISIVCAVNIASSCMITSVGAVKVVGDGSLLVTKKIDELNKNCAEWLKKLDKIKLKSDGLKQNLDKIKVKSDGLKQNFDEISRKQQTNSRLNLVVADIQRCINIIKGLDDVSLDAQAANDLDTQRYSKELSHQFDVLYYLISCCKFDEKSEHEKSGHIIFTEPEEIESKEYAELSEEETAELKKTLKSGDPLKVLLRYIWQARDKLNEMKNKINMSRKDVDNNVSKKDERSNEKNKDGDNKEIFGEIDKLCDSKNGTLEGKTSKIVDIIKNKFPKNKPAGLRAAFVFDVIKKYKDKGIDRKEIIKQLVAPVVREEMESNLKRCCEQISPFISDALKAMYQEEGIDDFVSMAIESDADSWHKFYDIVFYGNGSKFGFYSKLNFERNYWHHIYNLTKDNFILPIIIDVVQLNSLAQRLEELKDIGFNADTIKLPNKMFDIVFNEHDRQLGMYKCLSGKNYSKDLNEKGGYIGEHPLLSDFNNAFAELIDNLLVGSGEETYSDIQEKSKKTIDKIKGIINKVDDKYAGLGKKLNVHPFSSEDLEKKFLREKKRFYTKIRLYDGWMSKNRLGQFEYFLSPKKFCITCLSDLIKQYEKNEKTNEDFVEALKRMSEIFDRHRKLRVNHHAAYSVYRAKLDKYQRALADEYEIPYVEDFMGYLPEDSLVANALVASVENDFSEAIYEFDLQKLQEKLHRTLDNFSLDLRNFYEFPSIAGGEITFNWMLGNNEKYHDKFGKKWDDLFNDFSEQLKNVRNYYKENRTKLDPEQADNSDVKQGLINLLEVLDDFDKKFDSLDNEYQDQENNK